LERASEVNNNNYFDDFDDFDDFDGFFGEKTGQERSRNGKKVANFGLEDGMKTLFISPSPVVPGVRSNLFAKNIDKLDVVNIDAKKCGQKHEDVSLNRHTLNTQNNQNNQNNPNNQNNQNNQNINKINPSETPQTTPIKRINSPQVSTPPQISLSFPSPNGTKRQKTSSFMDETEIEQDNQPLQIPTENLTRSKAPQNPSPTLILPTSSPPSSTLPSKTTLSDRISLLHTIDIKSATVPAQLYQIPVAVGTLSSFLNTSRYRHWTVLTLAASSILTKQVHLLLQTGLVDVNVPGGGGYTPLVCAIKGGMRNFFKIKNKIAFSSDEFLALFPMARNHYNNLNNLQRSKILIPKWINIKVNYGLYKEVQLDPLFGALLRKQSFLLTADDPKRTEMNDNDIPDDGRLEYDEGEREGGKVNRDGGSKGEKVTKKNITNTGLGQNVPHPVQSATQIDQNGNIYLRSVYIPGISSVPEHFENMGSTFSPDPNSSNSSYYLTRSLSNLSNASYHNAYLPNSSFHSSGNSSYGNMHGHHDPSLRINEKKQTPHESLILSHFLNLFESNMFSHQELFMNNFAQPWYLLPSLGDKDGIDENGVMKPLSIFQSKTATDYFGHFFDKTLKKSEKNEQIEQNQSNIHEMYKICLTKPSITHENEYQFILNHLNDGLFDQNELPDRPPPPTQQKVLNDQSNRTFFTVTQIDYENSIFLKKVNFEQNIITYNLLTNYIDTLQSIKNNGYACNSTALIPLFSHNINPNQNKSSKSIENPLKHTQTDSFGNKTSIPRIINSIGTDVPVLLDHFTNIPAGFPSLLTHLLLPEEPLWRYSINTLPNMLPRSSYNGLTKDSREDIEMEENLGDNFESNFDSNFGDNFDQDFEDNFDANFDSNFEDNFIRGDFDVVYFDQAIPELGLYYENTKDLEDAIQSKWNDIRSSSILASKMLPLEVDFFQN
jgi:hypothetical protein